MRFQLALVLIILSSRVTLAQEPNTLSESEKRSGWRLIFDGTSADGFRNYQQEAVSDGWRVEDGALVRAEKGAGDLITKDQFENFELQLDYRISPGGNSGIMFHVTEDGQRPWHSGPEIQILDNVGGHETQKAGFLYQLYQPQIPAWVKKTEEAAGRTVSELDATRPAGEWNHVYLRVAPDSGEVCINGLNYYRFKKGSKDWNERVAKSKFSKFPQFGKATRGHLCLQDHGNEVAFRSIKIREIPAGGVQEPVDGTLDIKAVPAFPSAQWEGWSAESADGKPVLPLRPLLVTHAHDGSGRRFVLDQGGMIHVFKAGEKDGKLFLDMRPSTALWKKANEEGLLGLAFHPRHKDNGEFFLCYSVASKPQTEVISRFRVRPDNPDQADPSSEEILLTIDQPFKNHNGGSIAFGNDGFLYIGLGDGGSRNDPFDGGQNLDTLLGKILRIDVDTKDSGNAYGVPSDNPFVGRSGARPEIYAYGFRNPWQISCDRETGRIWVADVGQELWEEIDIVEKGGNYGWSRFEGTLSFGSKTTPSSSDPYRPPLWQYDHQIGKSITGGCVYRGNDIKELSGAYLYGDFVSGLLWALSFDDDTQTVNNYSIPWNGLPIFGFGQDEEGNAYVTTSSPTGQGVFRLE
ncbi:MAG: PQQ-dependent sugar dehydrogenase [Pirellulales bacterium]